ncbi:MAG: imidazole glycerol phosphate synthase subunit HisH [Chloroflexia bacterium]|nr:imidazole glycerol phosphate synthase subunit HisH [Chloroflexia bacterium]
MIAIVDYGAGNLRSIKRAIEAGGARAEITADPARVRGAQRVVLPGVGAAGAAMERLSESGMDGAVKEVAESGRPLLGICLGMQLLFDHQEEGPTRGLNLLGGEVRALPPERKVPHMGWNRVEFRSPSPLGSAGDGPYFYFVHSYYAHVERPSDIAAVTSYGLSFPSVIVRDNIWGTQFHPEKSGEGGLALIRAWLRSGEDDSVDQARP